MVTANSVARAHFEVPSRICVSIGHNDPKTFLELAHTEAARGEVFFEFCLEFLRDPLEGSGIIREFCRRWPQAFVIVTCRRHEHNFHGLIEEQLALLAHAIVAGARGFDLEIESARRACQWMKEIRRCIRIVSYHNYEECPFLTPIMEELESIPSEIIKVAVRAEETETLWRLMQVARSCKRPNMMLGLGRKGVSTRIIAPLAGRSFTYAAPVSHEGTARGQLDAPTLREIYRLDQLNADTEFILGFGEEEHSAAAVRKNNAALAASGVNAVYIPWPAPPHPY